MFLRQILHVWVSVRASFQSLPLIFFLFFAPRSVKTRIQLLQKARDWLRELKEKTPSHELIPPLEERAKELMQTATDLQRECEQSKFQKALSIAMLSHLKGEVSEIVLYALTLNMLTSPPPSGGPSGGSTMRCRVVEGLPMVITNDPRQVEMLTAALKDVPKVWKPILQPMGDAVAGLPGIETTFSHVLPAVAADADCNSVPDPDTPTLQNIKLEREEALTLTKDPVCPGDGGVAIVIPVEDVKGQGSVRRLWADPESSLHLVGSDEGNLYVTKSGNRLFHGDVGGFTEIKGHFGVPFWTLPTGFAASENKQVFLDSRHLWVGEIQESDAGTSIQKKFEKVLDYVGGGVSMNESYAYFCLGHSVQCLDLVTHSISPIMGDPGKAGCGSVAGPANLLLLDGPGDTALAGNSVFVADTNNGRVLCYDMMTNKCSIIFDGIRPSHLAADPGNLFIYDTDQAKIFHVDLDTWKVEHVLGTGTQGSSPEGLPPLSTHLGEIFSMAVGHDGELVYVEGKRLLRAFKMVPIASSGPMAMCAKKVPFHEGLGEESDAPVPLPELQPTYGAEWQAFCPKTPSVAMFASDILPVDGTKVSLKFSLASPSHGLGICLVPDVHTPGTNNPVDSHLISPPDWAARTFVSTLSAMQELERKPFKRIWKGAMDKFRSMVSSSEAGQKTSLGKPFHFRKQNHFEVVVGKSFDAEQDCFTWKVEKVLINGKERAGGLNSLTVGVDLGVRACVFTADPGGSLQFLNEPRIV